MLVIDEIHSVLAGTFREQRIVLNAIRFLANDLRIPLVCVGTHEAKQALMTDQQLADRFEAWECRRGKTIQRSSSCWPVLQRSCRCDEPQNYTMAKSESGFWCLRRG
jgi:hypothetical protein